MSLSQLVASWDAETTLQRFLRWVDCVESGIAGFPQWISPTFALHDAATVGNCDAGFLISDDIFEAAEPDDAVSLGSNIIIQCSNAAQQNWIDAAKEAEKQRQKQIDKWLDKMQKELWKEMAKAYAEMAKYYAKKYEMEKGS